MENLGAGENQVFALDIGTRSIIGIVGRQEGDLFQIEAYERIEHPKRAMIDGQIEDIDKVAKVAGTVKARLEEKLGHPLKKVAVAAAGRALKTCRATAKLALDGQSVSPQMVYELENSAVNQARDNFRTGDENSSGSEHTRYYCVGHSVVRYAIDDYPFTNILDHRGEEAEVKIIATFLPSEVVGSLRRCMEMIDLEIDALTLEPIAAMRAVLPEDIRLLNLALVDIGAGTADIALTRDGTVSGYTMATVAGDEITEAIIRKFLVDFNTAEAIKIAATKGGPIVYSDILGHEHTLEAEEVLSAIDIAVEMLAKVISDRTLETNEGPPAAVFMVGGGANTPGLSPRISEKIGMDEDKVAIAGNNFANRITTGSPDIEGPEYATPLGIALIAADYLNSGAATVVINNSKVRLFGEQTTSVMDALLIGGYSYSDLMGRNGRSLTFTFNGERKVLRGGQYTVADIKLNGKPAGLTTPVESGDIIDIETATSGEDAGATIADFSKGMTTFLVSLNGHNVGAGLVAYLNGTPATDMDAIQELDEVEIHFIDTVGKLCQSLGYSPSAVTLTVNGLPATPDTPLKEGDDVRAVKADSGEVPAPEATAPTEPPLVTVAEAAAPAAVPSVPEPLNPAAEAGLPVVTPFASTPVAGNITPAGVTSAPESAGATEAIPPVPAAPSPGPAPVAQVAPLPATPERTPQPEQPPQSQAEPKEYMSILERRREQILQMAAEAEQEALENEPVMTEPTSAHSPEDVHDLQPKAAATPPATDISEPEPIAVQPEDPTLEPEAGATPDTSTVQAVPATQTAESAPAELQPQSASPPTAEMPKETPQPRGNLKLELNGRTLVLPPKPGSSNDPHTLIDLLPLVDIDPANPKGKLVLEINNTEAGYLEELKPGDRVTIAWAE